MITLYTLGDSLALILFKKILIICYKTSHKTFKLGLYCHAYGDLEREQKSSSFYDLNSASNKKIT